MDISAGRAAIRGLHSFEGRTAVQSAGGAHPWQDLRRSASDAQSSPKHVASCEGALRNRFVTRVIVSNSNPQVKIRDWVDIDRLALDTRR